jgi:hypothetical protein
MQPSSQRLLSIDTVRGGPFKLEVGAGANAKGVAQALEQAKATA